MRDGSAIGVDTLFDIVAAKGSDGLAHALALDSSGRLYVNVSGIVSGVLDPTSDGVYIQPARGTATDRSGTVATGGVAQNAMAANAARKYLFILNPATASEVMWFNLTTTATAASPSIQLAAGQSFVMESSFVSTAAVSVIAATNGHAYTALEA
jgi:hypothetical protein